MRLFVYLASFLVISFASLDSALADSPPVSTTSPPLLVAGPVAISDILVWNDKQATEWQTAKQEIFAINASNLSVPQKCEHGWDIAWRLAKAGNLEARYTALNAFREQVHLAFRGDIFHLASVQSIRTYLYYHSLGAPSLTAEIEFMKERLAANPAFINNYPELEALKSYPEIKACVFDRPSQACTGMFNYMIPTFERFAVELDMLITAGIGKPCVNPNNPGRNSPNSRPLR